MTHRSRKSVRKYKLRLNDEQDSMFKILYLRPFNTLLFPIRCRGPSHEEQDPDVKRRGPFLQGLKQILKALMEQEHTPEETDSRS